MRITVNQMEIRGDIGACAKQIDWHLPVAEMLPAFGKQSPGRNRLPLSLPVESFAGDKAKLPRREPLID